jgi:hypothetical protein
MKRRKRKLLKFILPLILVFLIFSFIFLFKFKKIQTEPEIFTHYLSPYLKDKTLFEIFPNLKKIMQDFPEIKRIDLWANIFEQTLFLEIKSSKIIAQICDETNCFYLDNYGEIIETKREFSRNEREQKQTLLKIYSSLPIKKNTLLNPEIKNFYNENREFLFDPSKNIEEQIKKLHIFLNKKFTGKRIDLRITKKIYFK